MSPRVESEGGLISSPEAPQLNKDVPLNMPLIDNDTLAVFHVDISPLKDDASLKQLPILETFTVSHEKSDPTPGASPLLKRLAL